VCADRNAGAADFEAKHVHIHEERLRVDDEFLVLMCVQVQLAPVRRVVVDAARRVTMVSTSGRRASGRTECTTRSRRATTEWCATYESSWLLGRMTAVWLPFLSNTRDSLKRRWPIPTGKKDKRLPFSPSGCPF
jgi:hypothetical protein